MRWIASAGAVSIVLLLTGCGAGTRASPPTASPSSATPAECGSATARGNTLVVSGSAALTCFEAALSHCTAATFKLQEFGVDTGVIHSFTVLGGNPCGVRDDHSFYRAPQSPSPSVSDTCDGVAIQGPEVSLLACGSEGTITLPPG